ncbi:uncharacterized protein PV09_04172 [Verruconis gallopava]|uniref:Rhodopsin domain-containing protein n=1 Tax=Verruconis gallopava TaxID=253628 RepID=A0A0D1XQV5_9PEZI|nr:uncharacterized protein PV09_04172 [Verruconis gallopava]KIW05016.1 hypothetical protein PV09_04172 [Verruconis gallopava]
MENRGPQVRAVAITFLVLPWIAVVARCYVRIQMIKSFAADDWLAVVTLLLLTVYASLILAGVSWGVGKHVFELTVHQQVTAMKIWYWGENIYIITATVMRIAVGAFLLRIAVKKSHRSVIYGLLAINFVFNLYFLIFTIFQCTPIRGFWSRAAGEQADCRTKIAVDSTFASSAISAIIDWVFGVLPVFILWDLNVSTKKKVGLAVIMGLGVLASAGPLVRIPYTMSLTSTHDFLYDTVDVGLWSFVEPGLGLTVISVLCLRPLFVKFFRAACSTLKSDAMSISDMPPRTLKMNGYGRDPDQNWQGQRVSIHGAQGDDNGRWTPHSEDSEIKEHGVKNYGKAIRMTCEIKSVTDIDVVDVRPSRMTPPGSQPAKVENYV